ncbi:hypothetical protein [Luteipulveratus flavus]|uniref:Uncharacterized protein n=1 Tax=Luteipulveratus flavus TaxID=3031728 RepID=A0ABT6CEK4_9MICO|nr:hypothetical protein [Luteipulveratus sp. YIM 133296]MDF8266469.1 hypothetical protein [Luteipulveratus sp. YIM 133296]
MTANDGVDHRQDLLAVVDAAQQAAGVLAARDRGDTAAAAQLIASAPDAEAFAGGCLLLAELTVRTHSAQTGISVESYLQQLILDMETALSR